MAQTGHLHFGKIIFTLALSFVAVANIFSQSSGPHLRVAGLRTEYRANPLGIDAVHPRLQWILEAPIEVRGAKQTAYQILVASSEPELNAGRADLWDSGRVNTSQTAQIAYAGRQLTSGEFCWWKVRAWDENGRPSAWSKPARWSMGLLTANDWKGEWIGGELPITDAHALYLRREAKLPEPPVRATAYICGLGYYELYINGQRVGDHVLDPAFTDFDKRIMYATYDVTHLLQPGANALGVVLGNGWFHPITPDLFGFEKAPWRATPRLLLSVELEYAGGRHETISSDGSWKWSTGPVVFNCIRAGETYDARLEMPG